MSKIWNLKSLALNILPEVPSDSEIVKNHKCKPIAQIAQEIGLKEYELYGNYKAKINYEVPEKSSDDKGKYIAFCGITSTPLGEGKCTSMIGLAQAFTGSLNINCIPCLREPSQGHLFGYKSISIGGGYSQIVPIEDLNLHFTGDTHAVTSANNLIAAALDSRAFHEATQSDQALYQKLVPRTPGVPRNFNDVQKRRLEKLNLPTDIDPDSLTPEQIKEFSRLNINTKQIEWNRVLDTNDRFLREITIGKGYQEKGFVRDTKFEISVSSELMSILSLCNSLKDAKERIAKIVVAYSREEFPKPITCEDLGIVGAVTVLLKDAIKPNLVQTLEGGPAIVHCGLSSNIANSCSSVIADKTALELVGTNGYVLTECAFGADIGLEKMMNLKCRVSGLMPDCVVIVTTVRSLKYHGGGPIVTSGTVLAREYREENLELLQEGLANLEQHITNIYGQFYLPVIVAINKLSTDSITELNLIKETAFKCGASNVCITDSFYSGGKGSVDLAKSIISLCSKPKTRIPRLTYLNNHPIKEKIELIAKKIYKAESVYFHELAEEKIKLYESLGFDYLPISIAKTHMSFSHDPALKGAPAGYIIPIIDIKAAIGAGYLCIYTGDISSLSDLPTRPAYLDIDIDTETKEIKGLF